jgi:PadR family transcriptional regulator, regulatory protein PadR
MTDQLDVLRGTLELLILKAIASGPLHGYAIARWVKAASRDTLDVEDRALYIALHRLEAKKAIRGRWTTSPAGRKAKQYELSVAGTKRLAADEAQWQRYVAAMGWVLAAKPVEGA